MKNYKKGVCLLLLCLSISTSAVAGLFDDLIGDVVNDVKGKDIVDTVDKITNKTLKSKSSTPDDFIKKCDAKLSVDAYLSRLTFALGDHIKLHTGINVKTYIYRQCTPVVQAYVSFLPAHVGITDGMLNIIENEAELAALISHELAHLALAHDSLEAQRKNKELAKSASKLLKNDQAKRQLNNTNTAFFSQRKELAADRRGAEVAAKAGYDPYALVDLFDRLAQKSNQLASTLQLVKGSHLPPSKRAKKLKAYLKKKGYQRGEGKLGKASYLKAMAPLYAQNSQAHAKVERELAPIKAKIAQQKALGIAFEVEDFVAIMSDLSTIVQRYNPRTDLQDILFLEEGASEYFLQQLLNAVSPGLANFVNSQVLGILGDIGAIGLSIAPITGDIIDFYELTTGQDFFTGEDIGVLGRTLAAAGLILGSGQAFRAALDNLSDGFRAVGRSDAANAIASGARIAAATSRSGRAASEAPSIGNRANNTATTTRGSGVSTPKATNPGTRPGTGTTAKAGTTNTTPKSSSSNTKTNSSGSVPRNTGPPRQPSNGGRNPQRDPTDVPGPIRFGERGSDAANAVRIGEIGAFKDLRNRSNRDGITPDHIPSTATILRAIENTGQKLSQRARDNLREIGTTVAVNTRQHELFSRTFGQNNRSGAIDASAGNLYNAAEADLNAWEPVWRQSGWTDAQIAATRNGVHNANRVLFGEIGIKYEP